MTSVHLINDKAIWYDSIDIDLDRGRPPNSVLKDLPYFDRAVSFAAWTGTDWIIKPISEYPVDPIPTPQPYSVPTYLIRQRAEKIGIWSDLSAYLVQYPALMLKTLTLEEGIDPKDPDLIKGFTDLSMPQSVQDYLLSDPSLGV